MVVKSDEVGLTVFIFRGYRLIFVPQILMK